MHARRRSVVLSYSVSGLLHAGLVAALVTLGIPAAWDVASESVDTTVRPSIPAAPENEPATIVPTDINSDEPPIRAGKDALAEANPADTQLAEFTRQRLQQARERIADRPAAEQTNELEALARRLGSVSSEQSLEELTETIAPWLGVDGERATQPTETDDDTPFDPETAQVSDVLKQEIGESVQYVAVLVDAEGRTLETPLSVEEGESLYDVFQLMKQFPLLETVYRKTVMGLLDQLIEEQQNGDGSLQDRGGTQPDQQQQDGGATSGAG